MSEVSVLNIAMVTAATVVGLALGWLLRGGRAVQEKENLSTRWQGQLDARRIENRRLIEQNRDLEEQANQQKATENDASNRARELAAALKEAFRRRDELQRQIGDIRTNLEAALAERRRLESDVQVLSETDSQLNTALREKDEKIFRLSRELDSWQNRLPPLLQRFRDRDDDARRLEAELDRANERIMELETGRGPAQTHVESVRRNALTGELDASNDAGDNLQAIRGVGPAIEKTLHDLGIFRYSQIADMSEYDINRVAERLKGFRSRIYREDWIGQARDLIYRRGRNTH
jgi:predicted flap endonuclease-1-like 5' DNA nuclease